MPFSINVTTFMPADPYPPLSFAQLFDALPNSVVYYRPVYAAADGTITDFVVDYANPVARQTAQNGYPLTVGLSLRHNSRLDTQTTDMVFEQLKTVIETGQAIEFDYYNQTLKTWQAITRAKAGDGLLSIGRIITTSKEAALENEHQRTVLDGVLDTALNVTFVHEAIRDAAGQIQDFRVLLVNKQGRRDVMTRLGIDPVGKTLLSISPNSRQSGQFNLFCQVIASGEPVQVEQFYPDAQKCWYNTAITKLNDGVVVTGIDITAQKQGALEIERQAQLLNSVLDASISGIISATSVRNTANEIIDFRFLTANRAAFELLGKSPDELLNNTLLTLFPANVETGLFALYSHTAQTGEPGNLQTYYPYDGLDFWIDVTARKLDDGVVITFTDISVAKRAQQVIEQSRNDLQAVIDRSQTGIFVCSPVQDATGTLIDFRFKTINRMVAGLVGQTPAVITGELVSDWFVSYRSTTVFDQYKHTFETGEDQRFDLNYDVDGFNAWFDVQSVKLGNDVLVTFTNYTDLKRAQLAVEQVSLENKKQAQLLTSILDGSINGIMAFASVRDETGQIVDFRFLSSNEASNRMVGKRESELIGQKLLSVFPGNVESGLFDQYINTVETGQPTRTESHYQLDGLDFWLDISAQPLGDGFVVTFTDVSVVKRAALVVEQSAIELQTVIDTSQTGIFLFGPVFDNNGEVIDFRFRVANRMLAAYGGQQPQAVIGTLGSRWFPDYQTNGLFEAYRQTYLTGEAQRFDIHYQGHGIDAWLDIMVTKMGDEVLVTFGDYTPLKKLQQELESSIVDLQRSNANLEQFAYVASHDLQEPLRKIQAFGDILDTQYGPLLGEQGTDMIRRMQSAAGRMQLLIRDVLAYSRIATRREAIGLTDLSQLLADVIDDLETAINDRQATVTVDALPTITGDTGQLRQMFQNLLSNALKFTKPPPEGTAPGETGPSSGQKSATIRITTRPVKGRDAGITISPGDADRVFHLIEIADNGIGFEPHQAERIFQVFQRLHTRTDYQGTGIGLAIVKKVIENHNGHIQAVGQPGIGATFRILLPA